MPRNTRPAKGCVSSCGSAGCLIIVVIIVGLAVLSMRTPLDERPTVPNIGPPPIPALRLGDKPTELKRGDIVMLVNDELTIVSIIYDDAVLHLPNPSRVKVLNGKRKAGRLMDGLIEMEGLIEVEVMDGAHRGKRGLAHPNAMRKILAPPGEARSARKSG